jgi:hypothetical protein
MLREAPESVEFPVIWQVLDGALDRIGLMAQTAGRAIVQVADIFQVQAGLVFEELEASDVVVQRFLWPMGRISWLG